MKKIIVIAIVSLAALACHRNTAPSSTVIISNSPMEKKTTSTTDNSNDVAMVAQGKTVYESRCNKCHELKVVENFTQDRWTTILRSMVVKAKLNDDETKEVTAYVMANAKK